MNEVAGDAKIPIPQIPVERVVKNCDLFCKIVDYLTHGRVKYDFRLLDRIYGLAYTLFRREGALKGIPSALQAK